jgi:hypothetical protein
MYIGSCIDDKTNIACFGSLGVAREKLCQAKDRSLSGRRQSFQTEPRTSSEIQDAGASSAFVSVFESNGWSDGNVGANQSQ